MTADTAQRQRPMVLVEWRPMVRATLRGFCAVEMTSGLIVRDLSVHQRDGRAWVAMPAKPQIGRDDKLVRTHNGKAQYSQVIGFRNRELADRFSNAVLALVNAEHPEAFEP
jgi:hypothetical protein